MTRIVRTFSIVLAVVTITSFLVSCTASAPHVLSGPTSRADRSGSPASAAHSGGETTTLSCQQELSATVPPPGNPGQWVLGVVSLAWQVGSSGQSRTSGHLAQQEYGGYHFLKIYIYVTKRAAPRTTISILRPEDALLFYTSGAVWTSGQLSGRAMVKGATRSVSLANCNSNLTGYAGGILVQHPECVWLSIVAHHQQSEQQRRVSVPMGKPC